MPKFQIDLNTHDMMKSSVHGHHDKELIVLHETVSPDIEGMADVRGNAEYLDRIGYGIYAVIDREAYNAVAFGLGTAVFWTQGGENERGIGIELVSPIPTLLEKRIVTMDEAEAMWKARTKQLDEAAQLVCCLSKAHDIPLVYQPDCDAGPGVLAHWNVSQNHSASEGHSDCRPVNEGGYFPLLYVIQKARNFAKDGWTF